MSYGIPANQKIREVLSEYVKIGKKIALRGSIRQLNQQREQGNESGIQLTPPRYTHARYPIHRKRVSKRFAEVTEGSNRKEGVERVRTRKHSLKPLPRHWVIAPRRQRFFTIHLTSESSWGNSGVLVLQAVGIPRTHQHGTPE